MKYLSINTIRENVISFLCNTIKEVEEIKNKYRNGR